MVSPHAGPTKLSFAGFVQFVCPQCGKHINYPLKKSYRVVYQSLVILLMIIWAIVLFIGIFNPQNVSICWPWVLWITVISVYPFTKDSKALYCWLFTICFFILYSTIFGGDALASQRLNGGILFAVLIVTLMKDRDFKQRIKDAWYEHKKREQA